MPDTDVQTSSGGTNAGNEADGAVSEGEAKPSPRDDRLKLWDSLAKADPSFQTMSARKANEWVDSLLDGKDNLRWESLKGELPSGTERESVRFAVKMHYFDVRDVVCERLAPKDKKFTSPEVEKIVKETAQTLTSSIKGTRSETEAAEIQVNAESVWWELTNYFNVGALLDTPFDELMKPASVIETTLKASKIPIKAVSHAEGADGSTSSGTGEPTGAQADALIYNHFRSYGPEFQFRTPNMFDDHFANGAPAQIVAAKSPAMEQAHGDNWTGLSAEQQLAVAAYSGAAYKLMNPVLRDQVKPETSNKAHKSRKLGDEVKRWVDVAGKWNKKLKLALDRLKGGGADTLYRGRAMWVCEPAVDVDSDEFKGKERAVKGLLTHDEAFLSTTRQRSVAYQFIHDNVDSYIESNESGTSLAKSGHVGIFATIEGGPPGADIAPLSAYPKEVETLLMPNLKFDVTEGPTLVKAANLEGYDRDSKQLPVFKAKLKYAPTPT